MNIDEKFDGNLIRCGTVSLHHAHVMDKRCGQGMDMTLGEKSLANQPLLADEDEEEDDDEDHGDLAGRTLSSHSLMSNDDLIVHDGTLNDGVDEERDFSHRLPHKLYGLHLPVNIKEEERLSGSLLLNRKDKRQGRDPAECPKKKKRKQRSPAKILGVNDDGSLVHQNPKSHVCEHCNAAFRTNYHLQRHVFIHTGEKPFQCSQCDMRFIQKYLLQRHEKIHTGEKPFRCDECGMRFIQKYHMERHKRTHSGEKPYQCDYCHQYFSRTDRVLKHRRMCHENKERKAQKAAAKGALLRGAEAPAFPAPPRECALPKKKRQKSSDRPGAPPADSPGPGGVEDRLCKNECLPLYAIATKIKDEYVVTEYSVQLPDPDPGSRALGGGASPDEAVAPPKLVLKKIAAKKGARQPRTPERPPSPLTPSEEGKVTRYTFEMVDNKGLSDAEPGSDPEAADALHVGSSKPTGGSSNYDDAMQFLKKKRYLQASVANSGREYAVPPQPSAAPPVATPPIDETVPATILSDTPTLNVEIKASHEKSVLPDEVLQSLLDHYSIKTGGQPEMGFGVADTEVTSSISINSSHVPEGGAPEAPGTGAQAPAAEKASLLQEYSKFLQQALDRTSQNDSYLSGHSLAFVNDGAGLGGPLFAPEKQFGSPTRFRSGMSSPLRLDKSHFGLLVDTQHSFSFSGDETDPSSVSPTDDFLEHVPSPKKADAQGVAQAFQIAAFDQNFRPQCPASRSLLSAQFSLANAQVSVRGHAGVDFPDFSLVSVAESRTPVAPSPDATGGQTFG